MRIAVLFLAASVRAADAPLARSGPARVSLLELYSSEGCSSCPPADEWFSYLAGAKGLWTEFVPVAFQVDYWDRLGWKDPLSSADNTRRQQAYARRWRSGSVYTPAFVLDGREYRGWGEHAPPASGQSAGTLTVRQRKPLLFHARYAAEAKRPILIHAALLGMGIESHVLKGENAGKGLIHDFVVLDETQGRADREGADLRLRRKAGVSAERYAAAFWVTDGDDPTPIQAAGAWLP